MPIKGLEKGDGVPSSPCGLRRDKLGKGERTFPQKGVSLFPKAPISTFIGNKAFILRFCYLSNAGFFSASATKLSPAGTSTQLGCFSKALASAPETSTLPPLSINSLR